MFDQAYYSSVNYTNYRERKPRYVKTAHNLISAFESCSILHPDKSLLDVDCAVCFRNEGKSEYSNSNELYDIDK